jgi:hypothetical protein
MKYTRLYQLTILVLLLVLTFGTGQAITDRFSSNAGSIMSSATHGEAVTPHDDNDLNYVTRALYIGGTGNINVTMVGGETLILTAVQVGTMLSIRVSRVLATNTTATNIVAFD